MLTNSIANQEQVVNGLAAWLKRMYKWFLVVVVLACEAKLGMNEWEETGTVPPPPPHYTVSAAWVLIAIGDW